MAKRWGPDFRASHDPMNEGPPLRWTIASEARPQPPRQTGVRTTVDRPMRGRLPVREGRATRVPDRRRTAARPARPGRPAENWVRFGIFGAASRWWRADEPIRDGEILGDRRLGEPSHRRGARRAETATSGRSGGGEPSVAPTATTTSRVIASEPTSRIDRPRHGGPPGPYRGPRPAGLRLGPREVERAECRGGPRNPPTLTAGDVAAGVDEAGRDAPGWSGGVSPTVPDWPPPPTGGRGREVRTTRSLASWPRGNRSAMRTIARVALI